MKVKNLLSYILMILFVLYRYFKEIFISDLGIQFFVLCLILFVFTLYIYIIRRNIYLSKNIFICLVLGYLSVTFKTPNFIMLYVLVLTLKFSDNLKLNLQIYFFTSLFFFLLLNILYFTIGFNSEFSLGRVEGNVIIPKESLGFVGPNSAALNYLNLILLYIILRKKINIIDFIILMIGNLYIYGFTSSRTTSYLSFIVVIITFILSFLKEKKVRVSIFALLIIMFIFTLISSYIFGNGGHLDKLFSYRFTYSKYAFLNGIKIFSTYQPTEYTIDNFYTMTIYSSGLFGTLLILLLSKKFFNYVSINLTELTILIATLIILFMEVSFLIGGNIIIALLINKKYLERKNKNEVDIFI